ncbi:MAG: alkaline phosphatase [Kiritimatiellae bacterium]|nr:alkaline phosphatase [Kiritimatiellia bacterium]
MSFMFRRAFKQRVVFIMAAMIIAGTNYAGTFPKFVFLFIGDGMAEADVRATECYFKDAQAQKGVAADTTQGLAMTKLPVRGTATTFSKNNATTDSAAAATAMSSGYKTANGSLNVDAETGRNFEPMAQFIKRYGMKVGIISSVAPNHATPAGFYAYAQKRNMYPEIAMQLTTNELDYVGGPVLIGGPEADVKARDAAVKNGYTIVEDRQGFDALRSGARRVWVRSKMSLAIDDKHEIPLADHVGKAIGLLAGPEGFFMMVEGAMIDGASHSNDGAALVHEMLEFDRAIAKAMEFYKSRPEEVLIVVTSDHECGGLSLDEERVKAAGMSKILDGQKGSRNASAGEVFRQVEKGKMLFDEALPLMREFFGIQDLSDKELAEVRAIFNKGGEARGDFSYGDNRKISLFWSRLVSARAGLIWSSLSHTGAPVPVYAVGAQAERFSGNSDNTLISRHIRDIINERANAASE